MIRKICYVFIMICLLAMPASAEDLIPLPACTTIEQVKARILYPEEGELPVAVERGVIRYISQDVKKEPDFCPEYWMGGEPGDELDLTLERDADNKPYDIYVSNMCTRAAYSMALSYLGVDLTPGGMSAMLQARDIPMHYDDITDLLPQLERVTYTQHIFLNMFEAYQTNASYSPVYVYFQRPAGTYHALLVVAQQSDGQYIVIDSMYHELDEEPMRVYTIRFNKNFTEILTSELKREQAGSRILGYYQWRLIEEPAPLELHIVIE